MQYAEVFRSVAEKHFVVATKTTTKKVEFIISAGDIDVSSLPADDFVRLYTPSNTNPAHAARTWLSGHKHISDRARALLDIISQTEYTMPPEATPAAPKGKKAPKAPAEAAAAAAAAKANGPDKTAKTSKVATGEAKAPKVKAPPKLDADGNPIVKARKPAPPAVPYTLEQKLTAVAENPKRVGCAAFERYKKYAVGKTFKELLDAGMTRPDFAYDLAHGYIQAK
jgi:hypothetical protein